MASPTASFGASGAARVVDHRPVLQGHRGGAAAVEVDRSCAARAPSRPRPSRPSSYRRSSSAGRRSRRSSTTSTPAPAGVAAANSGVNSTTSPGAVHVVWSAGAGSVPRTKSCPPSCSVDGGIFPFRPRPAVSDRLRFSAAREPDDRQLAIGLHLVLREPWGGGGDLLPGFGALRPVQLLRAYVHRLAVDVDPDLVGVGGEVVVPGGVPGAPAAEATISQLPSVPGNQPTGVVRSVPLLRPTVIRTRALKPMNLPRRRTRRAIRQFPPLHHATARLPGAARTGGCRSSSALAASEVCTVRVVVTFSSCVKGRPSRLKLHDTVGVMRR